ncbi:MAG: hypothetical protein QNJ73_16280 [Gammaproteobacteria bacterium]|nr:hypothetical protein [Gammaproteobacteria bacterium]
MCPQQSYVATGARLAVIVGVGLTMLAAGSAFGAVVGTTGTVVLDTSPYPNPSDNEIFVFDEQQGVAFVASQNLNFGAITPGTLVNSHYVQYDPASPSGTVGSGSVTFNGPIIGVITSTRNLNRDLSDDGAGTSDEYFGLAGTLGPYPTGAIAADRGLGSPEDDLVINLGSNTLVIDSLQIPGNRPGNLDGFRVLTMVPVPAAGWLFVSAVGLLGWCRHRRN